MPISLHNVCARVCIVTQYASRDRFGFVLLPTREQPLQCIPKRALPDCKKTQLRTVPYTLTHSLPFLQQMSSPYSVYLKKKAPTRSLIPYLNVVRKPRQRFGLSSAM